MVYGLPPRAIPQCSNCLRSYTFAALRDVHPGVSSPVQQVRGKKKMAKSPTIAVKLLKDVAMYGRAGAIVPVARGQMRNNWFPKQIAAYVTIPQMRDLRLNNVAIERDFLFDPKPAPVLELDDEAEAYSDALAMDNEELRSASAFQEERTEYNLTPERSVELVRIFVPKTIDFYREPITKTTAKQIAEDENDSSADQIGSGAAAELLAVRRAGLGNSRAQNSKATEQGIHGSVSTADVLIAVREAMSHNAEAKRIVVREEDIEFVSLPGKEGGGADKDRVRAVGEFQVDIGVRGTEERARKVVRVIAQE